jgi:hypothetical protein
MLNVKYEFQPTSKQTSKFGGECNQAYPKVVVYVASSNKVK